MSAAADVLPPAQRGRFMGRPIDAVTMEQTIGRCADWIAGPRRSRIVVTVNSAILVMMRKDPELARACCAGDLIVADGAPVVWFSRLAGLRLPERVAGVDLMHRLLVESGRRGWRVYLLGAKREVVERLAGEIPRRYPGAVVAGFRDGYFGKDKHDEVAEQVRASRADILFIGMPSPFKEVWALEKREALDTPVILGVGGSFDVLAGYTKRAPVWMQRWGLEWSWRLAMEPRRMWKRYLVTNTIFLVEGTKAAVRARLARGGGA